MITVLEGGEGSASRPGRSFPSGRTRYSLYRRLGGPQGRSRQVQKISPPPGFDPRTGPARSQSLYRLSYSVHFHLIVNQKNIPWYKNTNSTKIRHLTLYNHAVYVSSFHWSSALCLAVFIARDCYDVGTSYWVRLCGRNCVRTKVNSFPISWPPVPQTITN